MVIPARKDRPRGAVVLVTVASIKGRRVLDVSFNGPPGESVIRYPAGDSSFGHVADVLPAEGDIRAVGVRRVEAVGGVTLGSLAGKADAREAL